MTGASIIIPAYNAEMYIAGAVESALSQTYKEREIIVVDDGSTDGTRRALEPYRAGGHIRYVRKDNRGPSAARNTGIAHANGRYISFLDADDLLAPDYLQTVIAFFEEYPKLDFIFTNYELFSGSGAISGSGVDRWKVFRDIPSIEAGRGRRLFTESLTKYIIRHGGFMTTSCVTVKKDAVESGAPFREGFSYGEDDDFFARVNYRRRAGYIDNALVRKREHGASITHDRAGLLRNASHFIRLSEIQRDYFQGDREIQSILGRKIPKLVFEYCWQLIEQGSFREARKALRSYVRQYRTSLPLYKLLVKSYLCSWLGGLHINSL